MIVVTATLTEAMPIIEALDLKISQKKPFLIFSNQKIDLIISKIGPINAASALSHILTKKPDRVLNVGICAGDKVGKIYNIYKAIDTIQNKSYILKKSPSLENAILKSFPSSQTTPLKVLADQEGAALVECAKRYKVEIELLKVVSDRFEPKNVDKELIFRLIKQNIKPILDKISKKGSI